MVQIANDEDDCESKHNALRMTSDWQPVFTDVIDNNALGGLSLVIIHFMMVVSQI